MKSIKSIMILSAIAVLLLSFVVAYAQGQAGNPIQKRQGVVDMNGDGICDITGRVIGSGAGAQQGPPAARGNRNGPGDGTGYQGQRPKDGTGYGAQSGRRSGPQDCTQPRVGQGARLATGGAGAGSRIRKGGVR